MFSAGRCSCTHIKGHNHLMKNSVGHYLPPEDWPPNSPDLSPIVNVWSIMAAAVYTSPEPQELTALERRLRKCWISMTTVQNLIGSKPDRLRAIIRITIPCAVSK